MSLAPAGSGSPAVGAGEVGRGRLEESVQRLPRLFRTTKEAQRAAAATAPTVRRPGFVPRVPGTEVAVDAPAPSLP